MRNRSEFRPNLVVKSSKKNRLSNSREIDRSKPYGFRTLETESFATGNNNSSSFLVKSQYTEKLIKEYYSNEGYIPSTKIYNTLFSPIKPNRYMDKKSQQALTERLLNHKDKIREKNRLNKIEQEIKQTVTSNPRAETIKSNSIQLGDDYNMYDHQIKLEIKKKAKWYDKVIEESSKEKETMAQAKPCPGSQRLIKNSNRAGNIHYNLYEKGAKKMKLKQGLNQANESQPDFNNDPDNQECTFQPKINKNSKRLITEGKVEDRLTTDARKRLGAKLLREEAKLKDTKFNSNPKYGAKSQSYAYK